MEMTLPLRPVRKMKRALRGLLERTNLGYRYLLRRDSGMTGPYGRPNAPWHNAVLRTFQERDQALEQVKALGLPPMGEPTKNWDSLAALDFILANTPTRGRILDAGADRYSVILPWLFLYGYKRLDGINLVFEEPIRTGSMLYHHGDITRTKFEARTFDAITCLSVIEHGVDLELYFREMARILRPGGALITSTDYWQTPIDTHGQIMFDAPVHVFTEKEIRGAIELAKGFGLALTGSVDLACGEKVVHWTEVDLDYTFLVLTMRRKG